MPIKPPSSSTAPTLPRCIAVAIVLTVCAGRLVAQTLVPPASAASAPEAAVAVAEEAASAPLAPPAPPPPPPLNCAQLSERAMSADVKAATAQSQNKDLDEQVQLLDVAIQFWTQAAERCEGRAQVRAQRNLADNQVQHDELTERLSSGAQCEASHREATALQDLAKQAFGERRWTDSAALYRKAESAWDFATDNCTGVLQELATKRREQVEVDAYNAEFCAPSFDRAREYTQKFRSTASGLSPNERQEQSQMAETLWRDTMNECRGAATEMAGNNAQALARERGTPWVAAAAPPLPRPTPPVRRPAVAAVKPAPVAAAGAALATAPPTTLPAPTAALPPPPAAAPTPALPATPPPTEPPAQTHAIAATAEVVDVQAGDAHYHGRFVFEADRRLSGEGRIDWARGDHYEGQVLSNQLNGVGEYRWADGQRYKGDWVMDRATGQGRMHFANGNDYEGTLLNGIPQGRGDMHYASGDTYQGEFRQGIPHGQGLYVWTDKQQFKGQWVDGKPQGLGRLSFSTGNVYDGTVLAGKPHGKGRMQYQSGDVYEGDFVDGQPDGRGLYVWADGVRYDGAWQAGHKQGQGTMTWGNGNQWVGEFKDDKRTENGKLTEGKR